MLYKNPGSVYCFVTKGTINSLTRRYIKYGKTTRVLSSRIKEYSGLNKPHDKYNIWFMEVKKYEGEKYDNTLISYERDLGKFLKNYKNLYHDKSMGNEYLYFDENIISWKTIVSSLTNYYKEIDKFVVNDNKCPSTKRKRGSESVSDPEYLPPRRFKKRRKLDVVFPNIKLIK